MVSFAIRGIYSLVRSHLAIVGLNVYGTRILCRMSSFVLLILNTVDLAYHYLSSDAKITFRGSNKIILAGASGLETQRIPCVCICWYLSCFYMFYFLNIFTKFLIFENLAYTQK